MIEPQQDGPEPSPVVLVVEDEVLIRLATADDLRDEGFRVVEAANADEAVLYLQTNPVDALVTDVRMPGTMDGLDLAARVRREMPWIAVFIVSGHVADDVGVPGVTVMRKPYDVRRVSALIRSALENSR